MSKNKISNGMSKKIFIIFIFGLLIIGAHFAEATYPTILYTKAIPSEESIAVEASINTSSSGATAWVEYSTMGDLNNFNETKHILVKAAKQAQTVFINIENLNSNTIYFMRVVANNSQYEIKSNIFTTRTTGTAKPILEIKTIQNPQNIINNENQIITSTKETNTNTEKAVAFTLLPNSLPNWLALILILILTTVLIRKLYVENKSSNLEK